MKRRQPGASRALLLRLPVSLCGRLSSVAREADTSVTRLVGDILSESFRRDAIDIVLEDDLKNIRIEQSLYDRLLDRAIDTGSSVEQLGTDAIEAWLCGSPAVAASDPLHVDWWHAAVVKAPHGTVVTLTADAEWDGQLPSLDHLRERLGLPEGAVRWRDMANPRKPTSQKPWRSRSQELVIASTADPSIKPVAPPHIKDQP